VQATHTKSIRPTIPPTRKLADTYTGTGMARAARTVPTFFMTSFSGQVSPASSAPRKWDSEIDTARQHDDWLAFEADIHQSAALRARIARALDRYGLGTSDIAVDEALDYLINKELGASARYFNQSGKAQFNQQQITHAVLSYMSRKEQQRHITDQPIVTDDTDHDDDSTGSIRASRLHDASHITPDEYAARRDTLRAIAAMIPEPERELYDLMLAVREPGTLARIHSYANRHGIGQSTVYFRIQKLAQAIQRHPWFEEITVSFRTSRRPA